jgi:putative glycosyltransferase (TIGR04372 family)
MGYKEKINLYGKYFFLKLALLPFFIPINLLYFFYAFFYFSTQLKKVKFDNQIFFLSLDQHGAILVTLLYIKLWQNHRSQTCLFIFSPRGDFIKKIAQQFCPDVRVYYPRLYLGNLFARLNNFYSQSFVFSPIYKFLIRKYPEALFLYDYRPIAKSEYCQNLDFIFRKYDAKNLEFWKGYIKAKKVMDVKYEAFIDFFSLVQEFQNENMYHMEFKSFSEILHTCKSDKSIVLNINTKSYINQTQNSRSIHNIQRYDYLINHLISLGYNVILQGGSEQPIFKPRDGFVDYAHSSYQSIENDFLIYSNCTFAISSKSGNEIYPLIFNKPILGLNYVELTSMQPNKKFRFYPKHIKDSSGRYLTWKEYLKHPIYFQLGKMSPVSEAFSYEEMSEEELIKAVDEFILLVDRKSSDWLNYTQAQKDFKQYLHPGHLDLYYISGVPCDTYLRLNKS